MFARLQEVMDTNDARFDKLRAENLSHFEEAVSAFADGMSLSIDKFYEGLNLSYQEIQEDASHRESVIPTSNTSEILEEQVSRHN